MMDIFLQGNRELVFLIHGLSGTPAELKYLAHKINKKGFSVFVPFFNSFGHQDDYQNFPPQTYPMWIEEVQEKLDKVASHYDQIHLGGLCLGATLALALAAINQDCLPIGKVMVYSALLKPDGWAVPWFSIFIPIAPVVFFYKEYTENYPFGVKNDLLRDVILKQRNQNVLSPAGNDKIPIWGVYETWKLSRFIFKKLLKTYDLPTLIIHSIEDDMSSFKGAERIYQALKSKYKYLVPLHDSYHMITIDKERGVVEELSTEFLLTPLENELNQEEPTVSLQKLINLQKAGLIRGVGTVTPS